MNVGDQILPGGGFFMFAPKNAPHLEKLTQMGAIVSKMPTIWESLEC